MSGTQKVHKCFVAAQNDKSGFWGRKHMKNQFRGIALILIGIQLAIYTIIDPWLPILGGDVGRVLIPVASVIVSIIGLILCFKDSGDK